MLCPLSQAASPALSMVLAKHPLLYNRCYSPPPSHLSLNVSFFSKRFTQLLAAGVLLSEKEKRRQVSKGAKSFENYAGLTVSSSLPSFKVSPAMQRRTSLPVWFWVGLPVRGEGRRERKHYSQEAAALGTLWLHWSQGGGKELLEILKQYTVSWLAFENHLCPCFRLRSLARSMSLNFGSSSADLWPPAQIFQ